MISNSNANREGLYCNKKIRERKDLLNLKLSITWKFEFVISYMS